jgi:flagellar biosynthesis component FlhA
LREVLEWTRETGKRLAVTVGGFLLLVAGIVLMILPIVPGMLVFAAGLVVLSGEYIWATRALEKGKEGARMAKSKGKEAKESARETLEGDK